MPERIMPGVGLRAFYDPGQRNWGSSLSEDLRRLSALVQARATSRTTPLPATGSTGQMLIVPAAAGADANALALWDQSPAGAAAWVTLPPQEGWQVWIADEARHVRFTAGSWVEVPRPGIVRIRTLTATSHMLEAVDLDDQMFIAAEKIGDISAQRHLASKFEPVEAAVTEVSPEKTLLFRFHSS